MPLTFAAKQQVVVASSTGLYQPELVVEAGTIEVHVGGGQPDFYSGSLMRQLTVSRPGKLNRAYQCS